MIKLIILIFLLNLIPACKTKKQVYSFDKLIMGTVANIKIFTNKNKDETKEIVNKTWELGKSLEKNVFSRRLKNSELFKLNIKLSKNNGAIAKSFKISKQLYDVLFVAKKIYNATNGVFDITFLPISDLWKDYVRNKKKIPTKNNINKVLLNYVGSDKFTLYSNQEFFFIKSSKKLKIDLGGIAKGYIIDLMSKYIKNKGINNFLINIGGDIFFSGSKENKPWIISVLNPNESSKQKAEVICKFKNQNHSIVTSGSYYRFFEFNNKKYSHIINPLTGQPSVSHFRSVSVLAKNTIISDAYATALYILKYDEIKKIISELDKNGITVIIVDNNDNIIFNTAAKYCR